MSFTPQVHISKAITYSIFSSILCTGMLILAQNILTSLSINQLIFVRSVISLVLLWPCIMISKQKQSYRNYLVTPFLRLHIARTLIGLIAVWLFLYSLRTISIAEANILYNTIPFFIPLILRIKTKTKINYKGSLGIGIAFIGICLLMQPKSLSYTVGLIAALVSAIGGAITMVLQRQIYNHEPFYRGLFYYLVISTGVSGLWFCFEDNSLFVHMNFSEYSFLFWLSFSTLFAQIFMALSIKYAPAKFIAPFSYLSFLFSLGFTIFIEHRIPSTMEWLGMGLIVSGLSIFLALCANAEEREKLIAQASYE